jgi:hypothetical protein
VKSEKSWKLEAGRVRGLFQARSWKLEARRKKGSDVTLNWKLAVATSSFHLHYRDRAGGWVAAVCFNIIKRKKL